MKRIVFVLMIMVFVLTLSGCTNTLVEDDALWDVINDVEYHNYDVWAGQGSYFFESEGVKYCKYMDFGSGVAVLFAVDFEIISINGDEITLMVPQSIIDHDFSKEASYELQQVTLQYKAGEILWGEHTYEESDIKLVEFWDVT